jgi:hypothetical protein
MLRRIEDNSICCLQYLTRIKYLSTVDLTSEDRKRARFEDYSDLDLQQHAAPAESREAATWKNHSTTPDFYLKI